MFDPYQAWLGIPKEQRPPTYYQLLGISPSERERKVIEESIIRQTARVRVFQSGPQARLCSDVLNQIAEAGTILLDPAKRKCYDEQLAQPASVGGSGLPANPAGSGTTGANPWVVHVQQWLKNNPQWRKLVAFAVGMLFFSQDSCCSWWPC